MEDCSELLHRTWSVHSISPFTTPLSTRLLDKCSSQVLYPKGISTEDNYIATSWIGANSSTEPMSRKRPREETSGCQHLLFQVYLREAWSAELVLCFADSGDATIRSFEICLARGLKASYQAVWNWLTQQTGCHVSPQPVRFSSSELAQATALWTRQYYQQQSQGDSKRPDNNKSLTLIFRVPQEQGEGLDSVTVTVPPAALSHFCDCIERARPAQTHQRDKEANVDRATASTDTTYTAASDDLPILRALQCFCREAFSLNMESFPLAKATCPVASLGEDGRCKPHFAMMPAILQVLRFIIRKRRNSGVEFDDQDDTDDEIEGSTSSSPSGD